MVSMELSKTRIRKIPSWELKMDRIQVDGPANNNHRQNDRKNSLNSPKHGSQNVSHVIQSVLIVLVKVSTCKPYIGKIYG